MINAIKLLLGVLVLLSLLSCVKLELEVELPTCMKKKIIKLMQKSDKELAASEVWLWKTAEKDYYYFRFLKNCDDCFHNLYDDQCNFVCAPDGGITGAGDGQCPEFDGIEETTLIWSRQ